MAHADTLSLTVHPLGDTLGAEIRGLDLNEPLTDADARALQAAWSEHLVLRFRDQDNLSLAAQIAFSRHFGKLDKRPTVSAEMSAQHDALPPEITVISNIKVEGKPLGALGDAEAVWHSDMTYNEFPPKAACLHAREVPPQGGDTHFANLHAAYEELDAKVKERIATLRCVHDASRNSAGELRLGAREVTDPRQTVGAVHPLVMTHAVSGKRHLMLGRRRNAYIVGLPLDESEMLLDQLWQHATRPRFTWTQVWRRGDLVMWDNAATLHRRDAFDPTSRRLMYRTQIASA
ncbi:MULTISPECIES: TauD/TfdA dioxygenase family protein [Ramlibacter]|uniref:TauD/TfdA family dioxygenase n=1 Tax=Ramlibacter pinisoli TaxID=2682844 RepID=A0A6N8J0J0_9BURK|nr:MULTISPECIES: TauD/TfdA family dioxygenase [Ramlibacter]MBA2962606.1 TauD/TfdA family dioxygenase [Ramlibacter sp. CGMCC 1.13660]MVQ32548.1 TauD/TfdA family dioxygenase [Ramlibacter pinisoli]